MAGIAEWLVAELIAKGVERIAARKKPGPQDLTVLLLYEQSDRTAELQTASQESRRASANSMVGCGR